MRARASCRPPSRWLLAALLALAAVKLPAETCKPELELDGRSRVIRVRAHETAFLVCTLSREALIALVSGGLRDRPAGYEYRSLFMGRLIEHPWLSRRLAELALGDDGWDASSGQARSGSLNGLVARILSSEQILAAVQPALDGTGYRVSVASVEKVLVEEVGRIEWLNRPGSERVPYDALVHFKLERLSLPPAGAE